MLSTGSGVSGNVSHLSQDTHTVGERREPTPSDSGACLLSCAALLPVRRKGSRGVLWVFERRHDRYFRKHGANGEGEAAERRTESQVWGGDASSRQRRRGMREKKGYTKVLIWWSFTPRGRVFYKGEMQGLSFSKNYNHHRQGGGTGGEKRQEEE